MKRFFILSVMVLGFVSCGGRRTSVADSAAALRPAVFLPAIPPSGLQGEQLRTHMQEHYWDRFDFADTVFLSRVDTTQMTEAFAGYVARYLEPGNPAPMDSLMRKAAVSRPMLEYFWVLAEKVLADPNSPLRSDELYIPVLRAVLVSPWFNEWERIAPEHDLNLAMQNRVGCPANDFRFTLASGEQRRLYAIQADYTLVFISNPGCPMCRDLKEQVLASPMLNLMIERGELKVLTIYPDEEVDEWRSYLPQLPASWINGYDAGCVIRDQGLYDLRAIPALYLLDRSKRVLLKDSVSIPDVEQKIDALA